MEVLNGLSTPLQALSFEFIPGVIQNAEECIKRLGQLGHYEFNVSLAETMRFQASSWMDVDRILSWLSRIPVNATSGDIYARLKGNDAMKKSKPLGR